MRNQDTFNNRFRFVLQDEFLKRKNRNHTYSLRAFARQVGVGVPTISEILNGKRPVTEKMVKKLGQAIGLGPSKIQDLLFKPEVDEKYENLSADNFAIISDWYHYAILELLEVKNFRHDKRWIAKVLNLSVNEVSIAIERLIRVGMLEIKNGKFKDKTSGFVSALPKKETNSAALNHQRQVLEKAVQALDTVPIKDRDTTSMTFAINKKDLGEAQEIIKKFRREITRFFSKNKNPDEVYQLSVALFPVSKCKEDK